MRRRAAALAGIAAVLIAAAGCGQDKAEPGIDTASGKTNNKTAAKQEPTKGDIDKFLQCLRENGVQVEQHSSDSSDGTEERGSVAVEGAAPAKGADDKFKKAHEKCKKYAPVGDGIGQLSEKDKEEMLKQARCMRKEGIPMPDPNFDDKTGAAEALEIPKDRKKFEAALKKCGGLGKQHGGKMTSGSTSK